MKYLLNILNLWMSHGPWSIMNFAVENYPSNFLGHTHYWLMKTIYHTNFVKDYLQIRFYYENQILSEVKLKYLSCSLYTKLIA